MKGPSGRYRPSFTVTPNILRCIGDIEELIEKLSKSAGTALNPRLRRNARIRTVHSSLAIENNSLSVEQVAAILDGKKVLGPARDVQEVRNALAVYEDLDRWKSGSQKDLLTAHRHMMLGLIDRPGAYRSGGVGIMRGKEVVHMAPPAARVPHLMDDLFSWLRTTREHPLVAGCVFHYEFEFIHPFADGNGRTGRLWQTMILKEWHPILAWLPVETVICDRRRKYYRILALADDTADATPFIEFVLDALRTALRDAVSAGQATDQVTDQVSRLLDALRKGEESASGLMRRLSLSHRPTFRSNYLVPALAAELVERTQPGSPRSPTQRYRLTEKGRALCGRSRQ